MRYTEARPAAIAAELLADIDKETVDWYPNYDNRHMQPTVLPARVPNLLVNGSTGIAVGMASNIPPHNLREVAEATKRLVDDPELTNDDLCETVLGPEARAHIDALSRKYRGQDYDPAIIQSERVILRIAAVTQMVH